MSLDIDLFQVPQPRTTSRRTTFCGREMVRHYGELATVVKFTRERGLLLKGLSAAASTPSPRSASPGTERSPRARDREEPQMNGYTGCACRDCFEIAIAGSDNERALCSACEDAGCSPDDGECEAPHAYCDGGDAEGACTTCCAPF